MSQGKRYWYDDDMGTLEHGLTPADSGYFVSAADFDRVVQERDTLRQQVKDEQAVWRAANERAEALSARLRVVESERDTLARRVAELERSLKGETARKQALERVVSNSRTVVQGLLALVKGECGSAVEDCIDVILAERYLDETTERCRMCGGSGVVAQKRTIEDGWGEVDACPRCCPAPPVRDEEAERP